MFIYNLGIFWPFIEIYLILSNAACQCLKNWKYGLHRDHPQAWDFIKVFSIAGMSLYLQCSSWLFQWSWTTLSFRSSLIGAITRPLWALFQLTDLSLNPYQRLLLMAYFRPYRFFVSLIKVFKKWKILDIKKDLKFYVLNFINRSYVLGKNLPSSWAS